MKKLFVVTLFLFSLVSAIANTNDKASLSVESRPIYSISDDIGLPPFYLPGHPQMVQDPNTGYYSIQCLPPFDRVCVWINWDSIVTSDGTINVTYESYTIDGNTITIIPKK